MDQSDLVIDVVGDYCRPGEMAFEIAEANLTRFRACDGMADLTVREGVIL